MVYLVYNFFTLPACRTVGLVKNGLEDQRKTFVYQLFFSVWAHYETCWKAWCFLFGVFILLFVSYHDSKRSLSEFFVLMAILFISVASWFCLYITFSPYLHAVTWTGERMV
uniref:Uncharacterized protein n=1 Tax=Nelumbo nucifera TaxID=4432 RepID=A0A822YQC2_NELNU|nr:TPA_asm: hypothetical protein HUJ06_005432 [Nelumbo nucifera]